MKLAEARNIALNVERKMVRANLVMTGTSWLSGSGTVKKLGTADPCIGWFIGTIIGVAANWGCVQGDWPT
jgi:hypothetical protein